MSRQYILVLVLQTGIFKKDNLPLLRIKDTIFLTVNTKKKVINMTRTFKIYSEWHLCYMFKSSISSLPLVSISLHLFSRAVISIKNYRRVVINTVLGHFYIGNKTNPKTHPHKTF